MKEIGRTQTGVRIESRLLKVLKALATELDLSLGDLIELDVAEGGVDDVGPDAGLDGIAANALHASLEGNRAGGRDGKGCGSGKDGESGEAHCGGPALLKALHPHASVPGTLKVNDMA